MTNFDNPALLSQREVKRRMGNVSSMTIYRWRQSGMLPAPIVMNRRNYWRAADIELVISIASTSGRGAE
jgi:hypothetical protein